MTFATTTNQINPERIGSLMKWNDFALEFPNLWQSEHSRRHFLNTRKAQMIKSGSLVKTTIGWLVDPELLAQQMPILLIKPDAEQLKLPLDGRDGGAL